MKKFTIETAREFLLFRACCEKFRIAFHYWTRPGGRYIVQAAAEDLEIIGY